MSNSNNQPIRNNGPNGRAPPNKSSTWSQAGLATLPNVTPQPRDSNTVPPDNWAQAMNTRSTAPLDLSASSFPSLNNTGSQAQNHAIGISAWQTGPPQGDQAPRQPLSSARSQPPGRQQGSARDGYFPNDTFSRSGTGRMDEFSLPEQSAIGPRRNAPTQNDRFQSEFTSVRNGPPGLVQRSTTHGVDLTSNDSGKAASQTANISNSRSPGALAVNSPNGQDRGKQDFPSLEESIPTIVAEPCDHLPASQADNGALTFLDLMDATAKDVQDQTIEAIFANLTEQERWTMKGYGALQDSANSEVRALLRGQDLSALGLNMNSESPLLSTYTGPFAAANAHPPRPLDSELTIPDCYTVKKVAPLQTRINGFMDETLFYIFYTMPRDYMQILVAQELMERKWRYHIALKQWLMRDETTAPPVVLEDKISEQGYYIFWDTEVWKKIRRPFTLRYEDLDDQPNVGVRRTGAGQAGGAGAGPIGVGGSFNAVPSLERMAAQSRNF